MTVRAKLLLSLAPLGVALLALGGLSVITIQTLGRSSERILQENYLSTLAMQRVLDATENINAAATALALQPAQDRAVIGEERKHLEDALRVQEGNITEPGEADLTQRLRSSWQAYDHAFDQLSSTVDPAESRRIFTEELRPAYRSLRDSAKAILALNEDAMVLKGDRTQRTVRQMNSVLVASAIAAFAVGLIVSLALIGRVIRRLASLAAGVERIGERDFKTRVEATGSDEIAQLGANVNRMAAQLEEYRRSSLGELLQAQQASQAAIESLPDPVLVFANGNVLVAANQSAERLLGAAGFAAGTSPLAHLEPALRNAVETARSHVLDGKGAYAPRSLEEAVCVQGPDGEVYFLPRATPVLSSDGAVLATTVILQDVTRLHRFGELKSDLVATAAHELRTPLTSLRMAIHLCLDETAGPLSEKQADLLYGAREDCERLQATVDELLELARLQAGHAELQRRGVDVGSIVHAAVDPLLATARERGVDLEIELAPELPEIDADPDRVQIVLINLVANAIRHSAAEGTVEVMAHLAGDRVRFEVRDHGEGIPREHLERIFEKFYRVPGAPAGGAGLGLWIAREIVVAHQGDIGVQTGTADGDQRGTTFWFELPIHASG